MVMDLTTEWRTIGARPISPDAPAGSPVRDDPDFLAMQDEIQKLESPTGGAVKWKEVVVGGRTVLGEKSKDLLAASYLCLGLLHEEGLQGLAAGLACLQELLAHHWDSLYPDVKRPQKRIDVLGWLGQKLETAVDGAALSRHDLEGLQACEEFTRALDSLLVEKLADQAPGFVGLRTVLHRHFEKLDRPEGTPQGDGQGGDLQARASAGPRTIATAEDCRSALREAETLLRRAALFARSQDNAQPWPYRMVRAAAWVTLQMPTPLNDGLSRIPPPAPHLVQRYRDLQDKGLWAQLLEQAESQFPDMPFWLDLHRMSARALEQLGASHRSAREAVEEETRGLVHRLPDLPACRFSDQMPFADEETRRWIEGLLDTQEASASPDGRGGGSSVGEGERLCDLRLQATSLAEQGRVREAITLLQKEAVSAASERERFLLKLEAATCCLRAGHPKIALAQLEGLDEGTTELALDHWEPTLCVVLWKTMWQALQQLVKESKPPSAEWAIQAEAVRRRISRVDVLWALEMEGKGKPAKPSRTGQ